MRYSWHDVVVFAALTNRWDPLERAVREGVACLRHAEETAAPAPEDAVEQLAAEFRYERALTRADDAVAWLGHRGLGVADWMDWVRREVLRRVWADRTLDLIARHPIGPQEIAGTVAADLICSIEGGRLARSLAEHAAATAAVDETEKVEPVPIGAADRERVLSRLPWMEPAITSSRLAALSRLIRGHALFHVVTASSELVHRELEQGRLHWIRFDCRVVKFEALAAAQEAALCVREDQFPIDRVAADARAAVHELQFYLGEIDPDLQPQLLAAAPLELIGPVPFEAGYALFLVLDKQLPNENVPALRQAAEQRAVGRAVADEVTKRVRWLDAWVGAV